MLTDKEQRDFLIVCYCLSRLDEKALEALHYEKWKDAWQEIGRLFHVSQDAAKNRRDEFDPYFPNPRAGWWQRALRPSRQKVFDDMAGLTDAEVLAKTKAILNEYLQAERLHPDITPIEYEPYAPAIETAADSSLFTEEELAEVPVFAACEAEFGNDIIKRYHSQCCITGTKINAFIEAVHIKNRDYAGKERLDLKNGLCLNLICGAAFRQGYITIDNGYLVRVADTYKRQAQSLLDHVITACDKKELICNPAIYPDKKYLEWHQDNVFLG